MSTCLKAINKIIVCAFVIGLWSCVQKDGLGDISNNDSEGLELSITVPNPMKTSNANSRAEVTDFNTISDLNIIVAQGDKILDVYYFDSFVTSNIDNASLTVTKPGAELETPQAKVHIDKQYGGVDVFVIANNESEITVNSVQEMKLIKDTKSNPRMGCKMFAKAEGTSEALTAELRRTVAMVSVVLMEDDSKKGINPGVKIKPTRISLHNVPVEAVIGEKNLIGQNGVSRVEVGDEYNVTNVWQTLGEEGITKVGSHDYQNAGDTSFFPLFLYENMQPEGKAEKGEKYKEPLSGNEDNCSYIQVDAEYSNEDTSVYGPVSFRYYLGKDDFSKLNNNFEVERNYHYQVTFKLSGYVVTEGGQIKDDGTIEVNEDDVTVTVEERKTWRVDTDLKKYKFTVNPNVVNEAGGLVWVEINGDIVDRDLYIKISDKTQGGGWIWDPTSGVSGMWMSAANNYKVSIDENGLLPIFIEGHDPEVSWIEGFKEYTLTLSIKEGNNFKEVQSVTITRYPAVKITMPDFDDNGNDTGKTKTFYVDAVDRVALPWGYEDVTFTDEDNARSNGRNGWTVTEMLIESYRSNSDRYMPYGTAFAQGSAMMAAAFMNYYPNGSQAQYPSWSPYDPPRTAPDLGDLDPLKRKYLYTIPSIAQWQYIEKHMNDSGVEIGPDAVDENKRLKRFTKYWTANHATSHFADDPTGKRYSYTYEIERGLDAIQVGQPYDSYELRTRPLLYRCIIVENEW